MSHLILPTNIPKSVIINPHFIDEETKDQRGRLPSVGEV